MFWRSRQVVILSYQLYMGAVTCRQFCLSVWIHPLMNKMICFSKKQHLKKMVLSKRQHQEFLFLKIIIMSYNWQSGSIFKNLYTQQFEIITEFQHKKELTSSTFKYYFSFVLCVWENFWEYSIFVFKNNKWNNVLVLQWTNSLSFGVL